MPDGSQVKGGGGAGKALERRLLWEECGSFCWQFVVQSNSPFFILFPSFQRLARSAVNTILLVLWMESLPTSPVVLTVAATGLSQVTSLSNPV